MPDSADNADQIRLALIAGLSDKQRVLINALLANHLSHYRAMPLKECVICPSCYTMTPVPDEFRLNQVFYCPDCGTAILEADMTNYGRDISQLGEFTFEDIPDMVDKLSAERTSTDDPLVRARCQADLYLLGEYQRGCLDAMKEGAFDLKIEFEMPDGSTWRPPDEN